ncbi:hypothetical protein [Velocimicrobium porci]|uniref:Uncharacterized protein n=1 Tax=Velocimicrobium porci TaxID=2606634 RepID=A0A6L5Y2N1_9FIRM|nr:hypothetical protein [Velocimicrobium porci]MSS65041.1 hypothetical protein [Velocimicrobium porci]
MKRITKKMFTIMLVIAMTVTIIPAQQTQAASWKKSVSKTFKIKSDQTYLCARMVIKVNKPCTVTVHPSDWTATPGICKGTKYTGNDIIKYTDSKYNIEKQTLDVTYKLKKGTYCIFVTDLYNKDKLTLTAKTSKENLKLVKTSLDILDDLGDDLG